MSSSWFESSDLVLRNVPYNLSITFDGSEANEKLIIDLEDLRQNTYWQGAFPSTYIRSLTTKTGSYKDIGVFARMVQSALCSASKSVEIDVLTTSDLVSVVNLTRFLHSL